MKTTHTPGPWTTERLDNTESTRYFVKSNKSFVALVYDIYDKSTKSNATLIAAAPELLKWLERAMDIIQNEYPEEQWNDYGMAEMTNVVRKAKGN